MIASIRLRNFKNFADETLHLGPFTILLGRNASGKSNLRDAFRFLHGIARDYTLAEIVGGKQGRDGQLAWAPIRGSASELIRFGESSLSLDVEFHFTNESAVRRDSLDERHAIHRSGKSCFYHITVGYRKKRGKSLLRVERECLLYGDQVIFSSDIPSSAPAPQDSDEDRLRVGLLQSSKEADFSHFYSARRDQPVLTQFHQNWKVLWGNKPDVITNAIIVFEKFRFIDPAPASMRQRGFPGASTVGDHGEDLPAALRHVCDDRHKKRTLLEWASELTPVEIDDFEFPEDAMTRTVSLVLRERGDRRVSADSASEGTLRFLAMLAAFLDTRFARLCIFEEIENGIHPARLHLLVDLIERQVAESRILQVVATTHSPSLVSVVNDETFRAMSVICLPEGSRNAVIRKISELPNAETLRKTQGLGRLLASEWMEHAGLHRA